jgi:nicotinate-nucleotide adenylyltransferase
MPIRFCIFGGTFDPIHNAHLAIARQALERFGLDYVLFIPAGNPPHKTGVTRTAFEHRARMVELACLTEPRFRVSRMEEGNERSYSIYTVERLQKMHPTDAIYFLIGADAFAEIETWHRWRELIGLVKFIVVTRPGATYDVPNGANVHALDGMNLAVSSSAIRQALARGETTADVPAGTLNYAREHGLYSPGPASPSGHK